MRIGLIAGNGTFPFLVLDAARAQGYEVVVVAIKEETSPDIEVVRRGFGPLAVAGRTLQADRDVPARGCAPRRHGWSSQAQTNFFHHPAGLAAGQTVALTYHAQHRRLLDAVAGVLADEGITLESSTGLLEPLLVKSEACSRTHAD